MKELARLGFFMGAALGLSAVPAAAQFQVRISPGTAAATTIADGGADDIDPAANAIGFEKEIRLAANKKFIASGHAIQKITGVSMDVRFDRLTIMNTGDVPVLDTIEVQSAAFAAIGPPFVGTVHLDGKYSASKAAGGVITSAQVMIQGFVSPGAAVLVGAISVPSAINVPAPVPFGPPKNPDVTKKLDLGVTQGRVQLSFELASFDRIILPGSAILTGYTADRIFTVNSTLDVEDGRIGDGICDVRIGPPPTPPFICTLRAALTEADQLSIVTAIHFAIPAAGIPTIHMQADTTLDRGSLGALRPIIIDGTSHPAGLVELDGSAASPQDRAGRDVVALDLLGEGIIVRGLIINRFPLHAIQIRPTGAPSGGSNVIERNFIGTDATGLLASPNGGDGVHIFEMPANSVAGNVIANNLGQGVEVEGAAAIRNRITDNSIDANGGLGIRLLAGNMTQSPPLLSRAVSDGSSVTIDGSLHGPANTRFTVELFANGQCDPSGSGEGETLLGSVAATTDSSGDATFTASLPADVAAGQVATATATDADGNTSEFSRCVGVTTGNQPPIANAGPDQTAFAGTLVRLDGRASSDPDNSPAPLTFRWTQTAGPVVTLTGADTATPTFVATTVGTYTFELVVNDGLADSAPDSVTVTVIRPAGGDCNLPPFCR
jgi:K319L-like, PKD domain